MKYELRPYQKQASDAAVKFFLDYTKKHNGLLVIPTGGGKSLCLADSGNGKWAVFSKDRQLTNVRF